MLNNNEANAISCLLINENAIADVPELKPEMFENAILGAMYREFLVAYDTGKSTNIILIKQKLDDFFDEKELHNAIITVSNLSFTSVGFKAYAFSIVNAYKARMLNKYLSTIQITENSYNVAAQGIINEIDRLNGDKSSESLALSQIAKKFADKYFCEKEDTSISTGITKLDEMVSFEGGDMIVIGARPAVGKSAFVTQISTHIANNGLKVGFFNLEMLEQQMFERFIVSESGIGLTRLKRAVCFLNGEKERYYSAVEKLKKNDRIIISTGRKTVSEISRECRHQKFDIVIIDYLQLVKADKSYRGNRTAEVGEISKAIKGLAMDLNIPIIALSQMNRVSEMKDDKEPTMSELREAGDIEQDASVIILLWNSDKDDKSIKSCKVEKNRQGEIGTTYLRFDGDHMRFRETNWKKQKSETRGFVQTRDEDIPFL